MQLGPIPPSAGRGFLEHSLAAGLFGVIVESVPNPTLRRRSKIIESIDAVMAGLVPAIQVAKRKYLKDFPASFQSV